MVNQEFGHLLANPGREIMMEPNTKTADMFSLFWFAESHRVAAHQPKGAGCLADGMPRVQWFAKKMLADSPPACGLLDAFVLWVCWLLRVP